MTNDASGRISGAYRLGRDTPRSPTDAFSNRDPGARSTDNSFLGLDFSFEASIITFQPCEQSGLKDATRVHPDFNNVPIPPTTLPSRAIPFKGFLTTLSLPREEVVTVRGPINRLGTFRSVHGHLDLPLRSLTKPISHRAVAGASVPTRFLETAAAAPLSGHSTRNSKPSLATLKAASPTLSLVQPISRLESPLWSVGVTGTHGHASRRDGRESPCPSRTHGEFFRPEIRCSQHLFASNRDHNIHAQRDVPGSRRERPKKGSDVSREAHGRPSCKGAERSLDPPEALGLLAP
ncbi:hypothetical protein CRG98_038105 [Punica granatum]|uniref:Uncharacterized protein n=1 Tax=Punica granatum TaxID=22663 RepID=A0A2I0ICH0_PUNGR|nr:hypothetical protein CRG98_038105 [Punica granatum]